MKGQIANEVRVIHLQHIVDGVATLHINIIQIDKKFNVSERIRIILTKRVLFKCLSFY